MVGGVMFENWEKSVVPETSTSVREFMNWTMEIDFHLLSSMIDRHVRGTGWMEVGPPRCTLTFSALSDNMACLQ